MSSEGGSLLSHLTVSCWAEPQVEQLPVTTPSRPSWVVGSGLLVSARVSSLSCRLRALVELASFVLGLGPGPLEELLFSLSLAMVLEMSIFVLTSDWVSL